MSMIIFANIATKISKNDSRFHFNLKKTKKGESIPLTYVKAVRFRNLQLKITPLLSPLLSLLGCIITYKCAIYAQEHIERHTTQI